MVLSGPPVTLHASVLSSFSIRQTVFYTAGAHLQLNCISVDSGEGPTWKKDCFISKNLKGFIQTSISNSSFGISKQKPHDLLKKNILKSQKKSLK